MSGRKGCGNSPRKTKSTHFANFCLAINTSPLPRMASGPPYNFSSISTTFSRLRIK